jgi:hypothetical protein
VEKIDAEILKKIISIPSRKTDKKPTKKREAFKSTAGEKDIICFILLCKRIAVRKRKIPVPT